MAKTQLENIYDETLLLFCPGGDPDVGIEEEISYLGDDVLLLEKQDLIRLLAKAVNFRRYGAISFSA